MLKHHNEAVLPFSNSILASACNGVTHTSQVDWCLAHHGLRTAAQAVLQTNKYGGIIYHHFLPPTDFMDILRQSSSQITLVNPSFEHEPALVILLNPDNVKQTTMTRLGGKGEILYKVQSNTSLTKCSIFRPEPDSELIALIERRDFFPDRITLEGQERKTIKSWLRGYGTFKNFPISFERDGQLYHWKKNFIGQLALFSDADAEHPIAWFERSKKRVVDGVPVIVQAWLALEQEAIAIQDTVVVSFLVVEHKLRTDIKARSLVGGRGAAYTV